jgi:hypothetical protein
MASDLPLDHLDNWEKRNEAAKLAAIKRRSRPSIGLWSGNFISRSSRGFVQRIEFGGIVIWLIAQGQLIERWAYLESPHAVH